MNGPAPIGQKDRSLTRIDAMIAHLTALRMDTARTGFAWDSEHMLGAIDAASELFESDDLNEARQAAVDSLGDDSDRLIAAAPDLLFALQNLLAVKNGEGGTVFNSDDIARAAIAKAAGR